MRQINYQIIPGGIISLLTFPGVIIHEYAHLITCNLFKVKVHEVKFFSFKGIGHSNPFSSSAVGWVIHEKPKRFIQSFFISTAPFFINTFLSLLLFVVMNYFGRTNSLFGLFLGWIATSLAVNAFPSTGDAKVLWYEGSNELKKKNFLVLLVYPIILFIYIANALSVVWFDFIYAYGLYSLVNSLVG
jgi:hypothetical protein